MNRHFDDAVTAYRNGLILADVGFTADFVLIYRTTYIAGMTLNLTSYGVNEPAARAALEDVEVDRETLAA